MNMSGNNVLNRDNFIALYNGSSPRYNVSQFGKRIQASLSEVHYSEKRSDKNSINFFKQRFTWCKSHSPAVNCQPD